MSFVERSIILSMCPYLRGSTVGGSTVYESFYNVYIYVLEHILEEWI